MRNVKRRSDSEIDGTTSKKTAYNLRARSKRASYEELSDSEIDLDMSFDNASADDNKLADSTDLQNSEADSTADNTILVAQNAMETEMVESNTNLNAESGTNAGSGTSNIPSGNSTSGEENVAGENGAQGQGDIQIGQESPRRLLPDLNLEPDQQDE